MTQNDRMLQALREAGPAGLHSFVARRDLYIANPSQRINELRERGHHITAHAEKLHGSAIGTRYRLVSEAPRRIGAEAARVGSSEGPVRVSEPDPPRSLFDLPRPSVYDPYSEAA